MGSEPRRYAKLVHKEDTHTERIGAGEYHYAGDYDGSDVDVRLISAISAASGAIESILRIAAIMKILQYRLAITLREHLQMTRLHEGRPLTMMRHGRSKNKHRKSLLSVFGALLS